MFDRVELIKALNSILGLMFDGFCQVCSRLAIYRKVRKNSLLAQFSVERYIEPFSSSSRPHHQVVLTTKPFSSPSRPHHQAVLITKSSALPSRPHHQAVPTKSSPPSRPHHQAVPIIKPYYQATVASQPIKSTYQATLSSHPIKPPYQATLSSRSKHPKATVASDRSKTSKYACYDRLIVWLDRVTW
jgi:hypothetical protein